MAASSATVSKQSSSGGGNKSPAVVGRTRNFASEVTTELRKATWPWDPKEKGFKKYKELTDSTIVVTIAMLLLGGYVAFWDLILSSIFGLLSR
ncbi:MAG: preprotein translocase subunit SecE [Verrucomicrobia bacterium]|nr:preprotein translocase subunit SecE [Verrucomicrobiota bacterium]